MLASSPGDSMRTLIFCSVAVAGSFLLQAQTPTVVGVANDPPRSPTIDPGAIGYVFGSNFGTVENTTVRVGGLNAQVLGVSSNQIRALLHERCCGIFADAVGDIPLPEVRV